MPETSNGKTYLPGKLKGYTGSDIIRVITGVRRCGKSSMLLIYKAWLEEQFGTDSVIYLNFDGPDFILDKTPRRMAEAIRNAITDSTRFLLLDEVQLMEGWENVVNAYYSTGLYELTITGSNAKMLSSELATLLTGRYAEIEMSPYRSPNTAGSDYRRASNRTSYSRNICCMGDFP